MWQRAAVSRGEPDGYRIFIGTINMAIATWLPKEPPFDPATDFCNCRARRVDPQCRCDHAKSGPQDD